MIKRGQKSFQCIVFECIIDWLGQKNCTQNSENAKKGKKMQKKKFLNGK
jgi:hypothetical protein